MTTIGTSGQQPESLTSIIQRAAGASATDSLFTSEDYISPDNDDRDFINVERYHQPSGVLFLEELDAVMAMVDLTSRLYAPQALRGTFTLKSQKAGEEARCALRFNLPDGPYGQRIYQTNLSSNRLAEESIDQLLVLPGESRYTIGETKERQQLRAKIQSAWDIPSGIWRDRELRAMVLGADGGRFFASCHIVPTECGVSDHATNLVLHVVAQTLAHMCIEDKVLMRSVQDIASASKQAAEDHAAAFTLVKDVFASGSRPAIRAWHSWRTAHRGRLCPRYFA